MAGSDQQSRNKLELVWSVFHRVVSSIAVALILALVQNGRADEPNASLPRLTLTANRSGKGSELITLDVKGHNIHRIETGTGGSADPSWSRDGRQLLFISGVQPQIYVVGAAGGKPINLTNSASQDQHPCWSPDGKNLVFTSLRDGNHEIYVMDADGKRQPSLFNTSRERRHRPVHGAFREAVIDLAFMPGKNGSRFIVHSAPFTGLIICLA